MRPNKAETVLPQLHPKTDVAIYIVLEAICWMQLSEHCLQLSSYLWVELCTLCVVCEPFQCFSGHAQCSQNGGGTREFRRYTGTASVLSLNPYTLKICRLFTLMVLYSLLVVA